jgi:signal transduction histidine kinase
MTKTPESEETADTGTSAHSERRGGQTREALAQDQEQAVRAIVTERRDARDTQERTDVQRRNAREAQDRIDLAADTQRRNAREAQDRIEEAQNSERRDAQDSFDARRDGERRDAFEQNATDQRQARSLEQSNQKLEAFAYMVCHDLRAPLRTMSGYSSVLLEDYGPVLGAEGRAYAEKIQAAGEQMSQLIEALLRLPPLSRVEVSPQPVDLGAEATAIAAELQVAEPWRQVRFTIQQPAWAMADRTLIRTVLENLLGNSWKFTAGRDNAEIELATVPEGDNRIRCYVRDNGAGFDPAQASKLFVPFQRLHAARQFSGSGIGLASVREIIEFHGGQVHATGVLGEGASFSFTLSARPQPEG